MNQAALLFFFSILVAVSNAADLKNNFYNDTCPDVEKIVTKVVNKHILFDFRNAPGLVRLQFHDCFVQGCDASLLLDSTPSGQKVEKNDPSQKDTLRGLEVVDDAKAELERKCPGIVSCTDVLTFAVRDAIVQLGLDYYNVLSGRRDGNSSLASNIKGNLPEPFDSVEHSAKLFAKKGFSIEEMVILLGSHSSGVAHCPAFDKRLYDGKQSPPMDKGLKWLLRFQCPAHAGLFFHKQMFVFLTPTTRGHLDNSFYNALLENKGILASDQALTEDKRSEKVVKEMANDNGLWKEKFTKAMQKLVNVGVLVGTEGEVRKNCRRVN